MNFIGSLSNPILKTLISPTSFLHKSLDKELGQTQTCGFELGQDGLSFPFLKIEAWPYSNEKNL